MNLHTIQVIEEERRESLEDRYHSTASLEDVNGGAAKAPSVKQSLIPKFKRRKSNAEPTDQI